MSLLRLIARLDIKGTNVVKGVSFEGLRIVGKPKELATKYAESGADELLYIDTVASLYGRNQLEELLESTTDDVFIPVTVGGGIRTRADADRLFRAGADKVAINTAVVSRPAFIRELTAAYGAQALVVSIEAKRRNGGWEVFTDGGRQPAGRNAVEWALEVVELGAGELLITSVDRDGTRRGFDVELISKIAPRVPVPVVASGGMGSLEHLRTVLEDGKADAVAVASMLHYSKISFPEMRQKVSDFRHGARIAQNRPGATQ